MGLSYSQYVTQIALLAVVDEADANFQTLLPSMIDYAELRIYRDLDLLSTSVAVHDPSILLTAGDRRIDFPIQLPDGSGSFVVSDQINLIAPAGVQDPNDPAASRIALTPTTKEFLDAIFGSNATVNRGRPKYYAPLNETTFLVGPVPDQTYYVEVVGTFRPNTLSPSNTSTFISLYLPDLFIMASMVYLSGYQRNFGRQSDDPAMAQSYEGQYKTLLQSALVEEVRKKYEGPGWTAQSPTPLAAMPRG